MKKILLLTFMLLTLGMSVFAQSMLTFNFEDNAIPAAWTNNSTHPWVVTSSSQGSGHSGTYCIKSGNGGVASSTSTISATYTFAAEGSISFLAGIYGEGTSYDLCKFKIDGVQQFSYGNLATWQTYSFDVTAGTHTFEWSYTKDASVNPTGDAFFIDDVIIDLGDPNACPKPLAVAYNSVTAYSAEITWTPGVGQTTWQVYYDTVATIDADLVSWSSPTTDTFYTLTGLNPSTHYYAFVRTVCGMETSNYRSTSFTTECAPLNNVPYAENFESYATGSGILPNCWSKINTSTSGTTPYVNSTAYQSSRALYFYAGSSNTYAMAIMPAVDATIPLNTLQVSFAYRGTNSTDRLIVGVIEDITNGSTFTPVDTVYPVTGSASTWEEYVVSFGNYTGNGVNVAFKNEYTTTYCYAYLDDVSLEIITTCNKPSAVSLSNYSVVGCDVNWTPNGDESAWEVVAVPANADVNTGTPEIAYAHPYTISSLSDATAYDVYVRAVCDGNDYSGWSTKKTFTTLPLCSSPLNVAMSQVAATSAMVVWNAALYGATGYTVSYSEAGQENWTTQSVTGTSCMIANLTPNTAYDVIVSSDCDQGTAAPDSISFQTHACLVGGDHAVGNGTSTTQYFPSYSLYDYSYTQQIFLASEMDGAADISSIAFEATTVADPTRNLQVYLMHTASASGSSWLSASQAQLVYSGNVTFSTGWNTLNFTTPFQYNGSDNLAVIVVDVTGDYTSTNYFRSHTTTQSLCRYTYQDGSSYSITTPPSSGTSSTTRNNVIFGVPCDSTSTCAVPNTYITDYDATSVTVAWAPGNAETGWELEYRVDGSTGWTSEGSVTSPYTVNNLTPDTKYDFHVRAVCGGGEYSDWSMKSARTACSAVGIPYTENFDNAPGSGSGNMVTCWTRNTNYTSTAYPYTSSSQHHSGNYSVYFYGTSAYYSYLASPEFDASVDMSNLQVRFWAHKSTASYYIQVGVMTDPDDYSTFVQVGQDLTPSEINNWEMLEVNTDQYTGTGRYIAFRIPAVTTSNIYIDDINIDEIPNCGHVSNISASNITTNSVDLTWTAGGSETDWAVVYGIAGTISDPETQSATQVSGTPGTTLYGLSASSDYDVFVKAVCSSESSIWMQSSFTTACGEITQLPFNEDFDNMSSGSAIFPNCWLRHNTYNSSSSNYPYVNTSYHYSGNASLYFYCSTATYNVAVLPPMDVNTYPINTLQVAFKMRSTSSITSGIQVGVMTDSSDVSTFQVLETVHNTTTSTWEPFEVPLTSYTGSGRFIALKLVNTSSTYSVYLDDLVVELTPLCGKPTSVTASNITATDAEINWIPGGNETDWEMVVVPAGTSVTVGTPEPVSTHPYLLSNLNANTSYDVYVRADCGTGTDFSSWSQKYTFTTHPFCSAPTDVTVSQIAGASALLTWTEAVYGATGYTIEYTETGTTNWISQSVTGNSYMLSGLTPETAYTVRITSDCDQGTAPAVTKSFTTGCLAGSDLQVGTGTGTSYQIPLNNFYNYTYTQQIFLASELTGLSTINNISFQYAYSSPMTDKNNVSIYLAHTSKSSFSSTSDYEPNTNFQLVYTGPLNCQQGWNTFNFTTPFQYNGTDNLLLVVDDNSGAYDGTSYTFNTHTTTSSRSVYYYSDSNNPNPSDPTSGSPNSSTSTSRCNVRFSLPCDNTVTCIEPNVYVANATETSLTLDWAPGNTESSWELEISTDNVNWTQEGSVSTMPYDIDNLTANTLYYVRLRSDCGGGDYSGWVTVSERTACAPVASLPLTENFDSYTGTTSGSISLVPYCWSSLNNGTSSSYSGYPNIYSSTASAASGSNSLRFYTYSTSGTYDDQIAVLPQIDINTLPINTLQVAFDARNYSTYTFTLVVGVMTDPTDKSTFMPINTITTTSNTYTNYEIPLNQYTGTGAYIALMAPRPGTSYNAGYVDNVRVELIPSCPKPINVTATTSTTTSVTLNWTETGTATSWIVTYGPAGFAPGTSVAMTETAYSLPFTVNGLNPSTMYDFYVQSDCDGSNLSNMSNVTSAATQCDVISTLPLMENFDAYTSSNPTTTNNLPYCWSHLNNGTTYTGYPIIYTSATYAQSGSNSMRFYTYTTSSYGDQIAILPQIDVNTLPMNTLQLTFDARQYSSSYTFNLVVGVMTNPTNASTFVPVQTVAVTSTSYNTFEVPLTQYTGTGSYIAIKAPKPTSGYNYGNVDNIIVDVAPLCDKPTSVTASNITATGAEINWMPGGSETEWEMVVVPSGMSIALGTPETVSAHPHTLTNLNDNTAYDVYVRADCGTGTDFSSWSQKCTFTTHPFCSAPTDVTVSQVAGSSALLTWTEAIYGATGYTVEYTETGSTNWISQSVTGSSYMLTGLTPQTAYTVKITSECDQGSAPAVTRTFTTGCLTGGALQIGYGTSTTDYFPNNAYYEYSYTQQIFLSSEIGDASPINSIAFEATTVDDPTRNLQVYLMHTTAASGSSWLSATSAQQVYSGNFTFSTGWNTINFTTPFQYNGTDNLAVIVVDVTGSWTSSNYFRSHTTTQNLCRYDYQDDTPYSITSTPSSGTSTSTRNNVKFGLPCDNTVTCVAPNAYVADVTDNSLTLNWAPGYTESSWEIEISTDDSTWTPEGTVSTMPYTISNLNSNTLYYVHLRSVCGGGEYSGWVTVSERTECAPIASVPYTENLDAYTSSNPTTTNNLPYCWSYLNSGTTYAGYPIIYNGVSYAASGNNSIRFYTYTSSSYGDQIAILPAIDVNTVPMNTLQISFDARNYSTYTFTLEVGIMTDPTNEATFTSIGTVTTTSNTYTNYEIPFNQYTGAGTYIALKAPKPTTSYNSGYIDNISVEPIPACPKPTDVHAVSVSPNSIELGWTEPGTATSWVIEYGPAGFTHGSGTEVNANTNPFTVSGLTTSTAYDFYIKSACGGGDYSNYTSVFTKSTECDAITTLPYTENFDSYSTGNAAAYPDCWSKYTTYTASTALPYCSATHYEGIGSLYFYVATSGTYNMAILRAFDASIPVNTLQATFMYRGSNSTDRMIVGVMTNPVDPTTFVPVDTVYPATSATTWTEREVLFNTYTGSGQYIAFKNEYTTASCYSYVDNLYINLTPTCPKPQNLHVVNATSNSIELGWTETGSATTWEIAYGDPGFDPDSTAATVVTATSNPFTISNLNTATTYEFRVRALCSATDISYWSSSQQGSTTMVPVGLPYTADFSANDTWVLNNGSCTNYWVKGTYNNTPALFVTNNGTTPEYANSATSVAALKLFTVGTADTVTISFDIMVDGEGGYDYFKLFLAPPTQQFLASTSSPSTTDYGYHDYSVNAYNFYDNGYGTQSSHPYVLNKLTSSIHVTAKMPNPNTNPTASSTALMALAWKNDGTVLYNPPATITNLSVTANGSTPVITDPTVATNAATAITTSGATLHATITNPDGVTITAKGFAWKESQGGTYTQIDGSGTGNSFTADLTNLTPSTGYTFKAFITFNGQTAYGSEMTFTTQDQDTDPCNTPTNVVVGEVTDESITISWNADDNVSSWNIQYGAEGGVLSSATTTENTYTINDLTPGTVYSIQVQANCGDGNVSPWSEPVTATTTGLDSWLANSVNLYPNPAKEYVDIRVDGDLNVKTMEVYDVYGKIVRDAVETRCTTSLQTTRINVSGLADGMYFVRVTTEAGMVTKTFVKR